MNPASAFQTQYPVVLVLRCQTCRTEHTHTWPSVGVCPRCQAQDPTTGFQNTIISGRVTDAMIFEQTAFTRAREARERAARISQSVAT